MHLQSARLHPPHIATSTQKNHVLSLNPRAILTKEHIGSMLSGTILTSRKKLYVGLRCLTSPLTTIVFLQEDLLRKRAIVYPNFVLDSVVNLSNRMLIFFLIAFNFHSWFCHAQVDRVLHAALDKYAFFAVTGSFDTLRELISMLEKDNDQRQAHFDAKGLDSGRILDVSFIVLLLQEPELNVLCCLL
jgi:hypothetical protein